MKKEKLKHIAKRITAFAAAAAMAAAFTFPAEIGDGIFEGFGNAIVASAETYTNQYDISAGNVTIDSDGTYRIYGSTDTNTVTVAAGVSANITLDNVNIDVSGTGDEYNNITGSAAFKIADDSTGNVTIDLVGNNTLISGYNCAGLQKNGDFISETQGKLTIKSTSGDGRLTAAGDDGAGIGGNSWCSGSNIKISGGTVTATGDGGSAGIGGGYEGSGSNITISGGTVIANGGDYFGAGIGGGYEGFGSNITISGGTVIANGGDYGAGIGGGNSGSGSDITISDSTVTATGGKDSAGIGGGEYGSGSNITISGGTVTATGGEGGAGIGGGYKGSGSDITISDSTVTATGGKDGAGIGGGYKRSGSNITISGGNVTATGRYGGAGIGGGRLGTGSDIKISGGSVYAKVENYVDEYDTILYGADIGDGVTYDPSSDTYSDGVPATITNGTTQVYLREIENPTGAAVTINGKTYPTNHNGEAKIYAYLPAKTKSDPNEVTVGDTTTYWYYDTANSVWKEVHTITATAGAGGSISPDGSVSVADHDIQRFDITPDSGYEIDTLTVDGSTVTASSSYTFINVTEDHTISVTFKTIQNDLTVTGGTEGTDYSYENGVLTVKTEVPLTVSGTTTSNRIVIESGVSANIILNGVNIDLSAINNACAFKIEDDSTGNVTIDLVGNNTLESGAYCAGLQKNGTYTATLGKLTIKSTSGTGTLTANGRTGGAGIGGGEYGSGSNITISGGTVTATGGGSGAGIGGGVNGSGSYITISGGTVTANAVDYGAGIGGGARSNGSNITISGGTVTATGGGSGAGIGGGVNGSGSYITISGGTVTANAVDYGAGIGGGARSNGSNITISGGTVTATSGSMCAGIGGGAGGSGSDITISGGTVTATGSYEAGIGGGSVSNITISGGTVTATCEGGVGAGIGGDSVSNITISGGTVTAIGTNGGAGIGGNDISGLNMIISGGSVYAKGSVTTVNGVNYSGADIGGSATFDSSSVTYSNGVPVTPTDGTNNVYLREIENPTGAAITINGKTYPTNHKGEKKIYAYLPAKSESAPNKIAAGNTITYCYYDTANSKWIDVIPAVTHTITATAGAGGSISPDGSVTLAANDSQTFTIIPDNGYEIDTLTVDGSAVTAATSYTFANVTEDHTISVTFKQANTTYLLTVTNGSGSGLYEEGALVTIRANTIAGNPFKEWIGLDGLTLESGSASTESVTFKMPARAVSVEATYNENIPVVTHTITATAGAGGSISPSGSVTVADKGSQTFTITPDSGYEIDTLTVDGSTVTDTTSYTFENVTEDHTISVTFKSKQSYTNRYAIIVIGNVSVDKSSAAAGEIVNVRSDLGYDIIVTAENGQRIAQITEKGSFVMPAYKVYVKAVQNETFALMATAWNQSYVYSYDADMNKIKVNSTKKRGVIVINLGEEYADKSFTIYSGRKSTKVKVTEGEFDENGRFVFEVPDGKNYTLVVED